MEKAGLGAADFGTLVHAVLEARLNGQDFRVPSKFHSRTADEKAFQELITRAETMADTFLNSELGKRCAASGRIAKNGRTAVRESEYRIITSVTVNGKPVAVMGQIDLVFEETDETVVVDFKTDRTENPEDHYGQLAVYYQAAGDIFKKPVSVWLYYLRSGRAVNATKEVQEISLEDSALAAWNAACS